jgi:hypothetical protein
MGMWWGDGNIVRVGRRLHLDLAMPKKTKKTNKGDRDESARTCLGRILASLLVLSRLHEEAHGFGRRRRGRVRGVRARRRGSSVPGGRVKPGRIRHASAPVRVEGVLRGSATPEGAAVGRAARVRQDVASAAAAPGAALRRRLGRVTHQAHPRSLLLARQDGMAVSGQLRDGADGARPLPRRRYGRRGSIQPHASVHAVPGWEPHRWRAGVGGRDKGRPDKGARLRQQRLRGKNNILRGE